MITIAALADCDGSDEDLSDSTAVGDVRDLMFGVFNHRGGAVISTGDETWPVGWPNVYQEVDGDISGPLDYEATAADFHDALEQWADWCDRDSARRDSLDEIMQAVEVAA